MYIYGSFTNRNHEEVTVRIVTGGSRAVTKEIGTEASGIWFADDPVEIDSEVNDTFDHLLRQSATVRLLSREFLPELFCSSWRDAVVNIHRNGECLFAGFVEPMAYSQPYNEALDDVVLNCVDALSALQYAKYGGVGSPGVLYSVVKSEALVRTFHDILTGMLDDVVTGLDLTGEGEVSYLYDGSKSLDDAVANRYGIFSQLSISELLFLGSDEDDVWQQDEVMEEILRYLNLHITQEGLTFRIFSWESVRGSSAIVWRDLVTGEQSTTVRQTVGISMQNVSDTDTNISIGEVYNQLSLSCEVEEITGVIESPLDEGDLDSPYSNKQLYYTEYASDGESTKAFNAFWAMVTGGPTKYGEGKITDWYARVMSHPKWKFPMNGDTSTDLVESLCQGNYNQQNLLNWLGANRGAAIISAGSVVTNTARDDNSPVSSIDMTNSLYVSVNGNFTNMDKDTPEGATIQQNGRPNADDLRSSIPVAIYTGALSGGVYSPADESTTNYIVISGKILLNHRNRPTSCWANLMRYDAEGNRYMIWHVTRPSRTNDDGRYYARKYMKASTPKADPVIDPDTESYVTRLPWGTEPILPEGTSPGLELYTGDGLQRFEFKYSAKGDSTDTISKVGVLACMLIIGDKCVVETGSQGQPSDFVWRTYKPMSQCANEDEYYQQSFTIGFDPKIGDLLVGTEFDIQNNIDYRMGLDVKGTAIPIHHTDKVSGQVRFIILGPVNVTWDEVTRIHPTFFRHTTWGTDSVPLLPLLSNIVVKGLQVEVYSDNALTETLSDNDIIYMSDTTEQFVNKKDDISFKIHSALTSQECLQLGVRNVVAMSVPTDGQTGVGLLSIYDQASGEQAKPEQIYIDSYYREYHEPRVLMEQRLEDTGANIGLFHHYTHPAMNKTFYVQGISRNLAEGTAKLNLKEMNS